MSDEARERAIVGYFEPLSHGGSVSDHEIARAFWDAAIAHHFEPCGVPTEPSKFLEEYWLWEPGHGWDTWPVYEIEGRCYMPVQEEQWCDEFPAHHWRRLRMPPPPEEE